MRRSLSSLAFLLALGGCGGGVVPTMGDDAGTDFGAGGGDAGTSDAGHATDDLGADVDAGGDPDSGVGDVDAGGDPDSGVVDVDLGTDAGPIDSCPGAPMPADGCCYATSDCGGGNTCYNGSCSFFSMAGRCMPPHDPGHCWTSADCMMGQTCMGGNVCGCSGCLPFQHDMQGTCMGFPFP